MRYRVPVQLVPEELLGMSVDCPECGQRTQVPWLEELSHPKQPISPKDENARGHWVPVSFDFNCRICQVSIRVNVPTKEIDSVWTVYGDEAERRNANDYFFSISLVALHRSQAQSVERKIAKLKASVRPKVDPQSWSLHFTEIIDDGRHGDRKFELNSFQEKIRFAKKLARIIRDAHPHLRMFSFSGRRTLCGEKKEKARQIREHKRDVYCMALISSLLEFRARNKGLRWVFDYVKDSSHGDRVEGWAQEVFLGLQHIPLFTYLSSGATVLEPQFVKPGSHFLLEIADFNSYCVGREYQKINEDSQTEFPTSLLGRNFYQSFMADGSATGTWSRGFPVQAFYGT